MTIEAGAVVVLKSGGMAMTVVSADDDAAECVWCGEEGELFRETIPTVALMVAVEKDEDEEEDEEEDEDSEDNGDEEHDEDDGEDDDDHRSSSKKKKAA
ncbi:MAG: DUF2158 domain-containing protein [Pseudomonadota bacterium]